MKRTDPGYVNFHQRLARRRGKAREYACVRCGQPALDWAHRHDTDDQDYANYDPMCRTCHRAYDHDIIHTPEARAKQAAGGRLGMARRWKSDLPSA